MKALVLFTAVLGLSFSAFAEKNEIIPEMPTKKYVKTVTKCWTNNDGAHQQFCATYKEKQNWKAGVVDPNDKYYKTNGGK